MLDKSKPFFPTCCECQRVLFDSNEIVLHRCSDCAELLTFTGPESDFKDGKWSISDAAQLRSDTGRN